MNPVNIKTSIKGQQKRTDDCSGCKMRRRESELRDPALLDCESLGQQSSIYRYIEAKCNLFSSFLVSIFSSFRITRAAECFRMLLRYLRLSGAITQNQRPLVLLRGPPSVRLFRRPPSHNGVVGAFASPIIRLSKRSSDICRLNQALVASGFRKSCHIRVLQVTCNAGDLRITYI